MKKILDRIYNNNKCPSCNVPISYWHKISLIDISKEHHCKKCGNYIKLPAMINMLITIKLILLAAAVGTLNMNIINLIILFVVGLLFIICIELPFIPIKD